jgi:vitamin B12 transporter
LKKGKSMYKTITHSLLLSVLLMVTAHGVEKLEEVEVTSTKSTQSLKETTSSITIITAEQIAAEGYLTVAQALRSIAGVSVASSGGLGQNASLFIRGSDGGKVLVLLDGMRLNDPSTTNGKAFLENLTTTNIEQIEVLKGAASSIWGSNASVGVVNIITKKAKEGVEGSLSVAHGSHKTTTTALNLGYQQDALTLSFQGGYTQSDSFSAQTPREAEADAYENQNSKILLGYKFSDIQEVRLTHYITNNESDYDLFAEDSTSTIESDQKQTQLQYRYHMSNGEMRVEASSGRFERTARDAYGGTSRFESDIKELGVYGKFAYQKGKSHVGIEHKEFDGFNHYTSPSFSADPAKAAYTNKALYVANSYHIADATLLETNVRYDDFNTFDGKFTYKVGLKHTLDNNLYGLANYYTAYDMPSIYQFANQAQGSALTPSYTKGYELAVGYKTLFKVTYFQNRIEDEVIYLNYSYRNQDEIQTFKGIEVETNYYIERLMLNLHANYTKLWDIDETLLRRPEEQINLTFDKSFTEHTHLSLGYNYIGQRYDMAFDPVSFVSSSVETGNYSLWHLHYGHSFENGVTLNLHVENLFDEAYSSVYGYSSAGRTWLVNLAYKF